MKYVKKCNSKFKQIKDRNDVIKELVNEFYTKDGKSFCNSDTLAKDFMFRIHENFGLMPNDWIYDKVHCMLLNNDEGYVDDSIDGYIDIYTSDLIDWSKTFNSYVDDALDSGLRELTHEQAISYAQYNVLSEIASIINDFIDDQLSE